MYGALTIEEAVRGHSALRNPVLARTLEKIGVIEGWGSGLKRITELCKNYTPGFNHLEIQEIGDMLRFNIYRPMSNNGQNETENVDGMSNMSNKMSNIPEMSNKMSNISEMSDVEQKRVDVIIKYLEANDSITKSKAAEILNIEYKTAQRLLSKAENLSIIDSEGENKGRVYILHGKM